MHVYLSGYLRGVFCTVERGHLHVDTTSSPVSSGEGTVRSILNINHIYIG